MTNVTSKRCVTRQELQAYGVCSIWAPGSVYIYVRSVAIFIRKQCKFANRSCNLIIDNSLLAKF